MMTNECMGEWIRILFNSVRLVNGKRSTDWTELNRTDVWVGGGQQQWQRLIVLLCPSPSLTARSTIAFVWIWLCWRWWWSFYPHHHHLSSIWSLIMRRWTEYELLSLELIYWLHFYTYSVCNQTNTFAVDDKLRVILCFPYNTSAPVTVLPLIEKLWIANNYNEGEGDEMTLLIMQFVLLCVLSGLTNSWTCHQPTDWARDRERKTLKIIN